MYCASVQAAKELFGLSLGFIGVVKQVTRHFPMAYLSHVELGEQGDQKECLRLEPASQASCLCSVGP